MRYAHEGQAYRATLLEAVKDIKPHAIIGVSTEAGAFDRLVCKAMAKNHKHPLIFALSNPTSKSECTARQAYEWTEGRALFASGSPFDPVTLSDGRTLVPGQGNNAYIFPGVALGILLAGAKRVTDHHFLVAARSLAAQVTTEEMRQGLLYPKLDRIRDVRYVFRPPAHSHLELLMCVYTYVTNVTMLCANLSCSG